MTMNEDENISLAAVLSNTAKLLEVLSAKAAENQAAGEKLLIGTVHAVPEDTELKVKAGDKILFAKYGATETRLDDADVYFVRSGEVLAVLE